MVMHQPLLSLDWNLLFSLITVTVLVLILKKFFFEKVHNFMVKREEEIKDEIKKAEDMNAQAEALHKEYQQELEKAEEEKRSIINAARNEAGEEAEKLIIEAHKEAARIREENEVAIQQRKEEAKKELENEVSDLAILAAQRILEKNATSFATGIPGDILTESEEMSIRHQLDELKIHMNQDE